MQCQMQKDLFLIQSVNECDDQKLLLLPQDVLFLLLALLVVVGFFPCFNYKPYVDQA